MCIYNVHISIPCICICCMPTLRTSLPDLNADRGVFAVEFTWFTCPKIVTKWEVKSFRVIFTVGWMRRQLAQRQESGGAATRLTELHNEAKKLKIGWSRYIYIYVHIMYIYIYMICIYIYGFLGLWILAHFQWSPMKLIMIFTCLCHENCWKRAYPLYKFGENQTAYLLGIKQDNGK